MEIGVCGCVCYECTLYGSGCEGCHVIEGKACWLNEVNLEVCDFYDCCVSGKKLYHCGECSEIPCEKFFKNKNPKWTHEEHMRIVESRVSMLKDLVGRKAGK